MWVPTIIVNIAKLDGVYVKYVLAVCAVIFVTIVTSTLGYHAVLLYIYAIAIGSLYFSKTINVLTTISNKINHRLCGQWEKALDICKNSGLGECGFSKL